VDAAVWGFIGVVIGAGVTGLLALAAEHVRAGREERLDRLKHQDNRRLDRDRFQQKTLIDLQEAIKELISLEVAIVTGQQRGSSLLDEVNRNGALSWQVLTLGSLVSDQHVRETALTLSNTASRVRGKDAVSDAASNEVARLAGDLLRQSGALIEKLFDGPSGDESKGQ
jgi:hypothetical protein